jgi:beta-lactamase class A
MRSTTRALALAALAMGAPAALRSQSSDASVARLSARIAARLDSLPAQTAFYAKQLRTGREIAIRADVPMNTASVIKLPVMLLAERDADAGKLALDTRYTIRPEDQRRGSGLLQTFAPGLSPTFRDIITQMIITSDNTATDIMIHKVGLPRVNEMLKKDGYKETRLLFTTGDLFREVWILADPANRKMTDREVFERSFPRDAKVEKAMPAFVADSTKWLGRTTAREISRLLEGIERCTVASARACKEMKGILLEQFYSSRLPQRISFRASIAHKTGDWPPYLGNDVGIIDAAGGPIVIAVFTNVNRGPFFDVEATIGRIAEDVLNAWGSGGR